MVTVYRTGDGEQWNLLDPTPRGIPRDAGSSFGLRGCTYLPITPWGEGLQQVPTDGWNDTLQIDIAGEIDLEAQLLQGTLTARCSGAPLELVTTLFTQTAGSSVREMFRRFFGAVSCDSVRFDGNVVCMTGGWRARNQDGLLLLPGLREISLSGTRTASMLLPAPPDSFRIDAPAVEVLNLSAVLPSEPLSLPLPVSEDGYTCSLSFQGGTILLRETADITAQNPRILGTLLLRSGTSARTLVMP